VVEQRRDSGLAPINGARIYYECAGEGRPFVMIHAGVADNRQWENEFGYFAQHFRVVRFDTRGYGVSEPVAGEFSHLRDLTALLEYLHVDDPLILMGCSMGGGLAMDFALAHPTKVRALIMVGSGPSGLQLDVPIPFELRIRWLVSVLARRLGALDWMAELDTRTWFDGIGRTSAQVNQAMRKLAYDMGRKALAHESKKLGKRLPDADTPAAKRLDELRVPVLVIVGVHDLPYLLAAADYMAQHIPFARKVSMQDAAHLPNMDQPEEFRRVVETFLFDSVAK
jgi:pimeloyl-ACP methyl ester carboxylesterase